MYYLPTKTASIAADCLAFVAFRHTRARGVRLCTSPHVAASFFQLDTVHCESGACQVRPDHNALPVFGIKSFGKF